MAHKTARGQFAIERKRLAEYVSLQRQGRNVSVEILQHLGSRLAAAYLDAFYPSEAADGLQLGEANDVVRAIYPDFVGLQLSDE